MEPDGQRGWWKACYAADPCLFIPAPSGAGLEAAGRFRVAGAGRVLDLGSGHGRDNLHFARAGLDVTALDYADEVVLRLGRAAASAGLADRIAVLRHDVRARLPFPDGAFGAVFAHMLLCMALTDDKLGALVAEVRRVLRPGGLFACTARTYRDPHCGSGVHHGGDLWETGGFVVHFFSPATVERLVCVTMRRPGGA